MRHRPRVGWIFLASAFAGCGDATGPPDSPAVPDELWIYATGLVMDPGDTVTLGVTAWDDLAQQYYRAPRTLGWMWNVSYSLRWWSSDSSVAIVDRRGRVAALGPGRTVVWSAVGERMDSATIFVRPTPGPGDLRFREVHAGGWVTCGLTDDGSAYCWGWGLHGALGIGRARHFTGAAIPVRVTGGHRFSALAVGSGHACGLTGDGRAYCWGSDWYGELGVGRQMSDLTPIQGEGQPIPVDTNVRFAAIAAGGSSTCALDAVGTPYCWGWNHRGQVGTGSFSQTVGVTRPQPVASSPSFSTLVSGVFHYCGLTSLGDAYCWGENGRGELGNGLRASAPSPVPVLGGLSFLALAAGRESCGLTGDGSVYCWGLVGDLVATSPRLLAGAPRFAAITSGLAACGLTPSGEAFCWGENEGGALGNGVSDWKYAASPQRVALAEPFVQISAGGTHTCGVTAGGEAYCWGSNSHGQLGNGQIQAWNAMFVSVSAVPSRVLGVP